VIAIRLPIADVGSKQIHLLSSWLIMRN